MGDFLLDWFGFNLASKSVYLTRVKLLELPFNYSAFLVIAIINRDACYLFVLVETMF